MSRRLIATLMLAGFTVVAGACSNSSTAPSAVAPKFTATLSPANEVPAITNADQTGSGSVTVTLNLTKDSAGNITAATGDFTVTLSGFPAGTTLTGAHIHNAAAGTNGSIVVPLPLASGEVSLANGSGTFTKLGVSFSDPAIAQGMLNTPANYYFNVHTTINVGGAARGQLVRAN
jgi:hypothetical protein